MMAIRRMILPMAGRRDFTCGPSHLTASPKNDSGFMVMSKVCYYQITIIRFETREVWGNVKDRALTFIFTQVSIYICSGTATDHSHLYQSFGRNCLKYEASELRYTQVSVWNYAISTLTACTLSIDPQTWQVVHVCFCGLASLVGIVLDKWTFEYQLFNRALDIQKI